MSGTVPQATSWPTLMDGSNATGQQAMYAHVNGQQVITNSNGHCGTAYSRQMGILTPQQRHAMQQLQQQGGQLKRVPRQVVAGGAMGGLGAGGSAASWGPGQGPAYNAMLLKSVQGQGVVGQAQSMVLSPQLSTVGSGGHIGGPLSAMPAKAEDTGSSVNLRVSTRSPQVPVHYNTMAGESNNGAAGMLAANGVPQVVSGGVKHDVANVGVVSALGTPGTTLTSPRPVAPSPQEQHAGGQFPVTNGNSSSVASTDGLGASQNGTPESNNAAEKNIQGHGNFDAVRENVEHGLDKGLGPHFGNGETCDFENGGGGLDEGSDEGPLFNELLTDPSPGVYGDSLKFDALDLELDLGG